MRSVAEALSSIRRGGVGLMRSVAENGLVTPAAPPRGPLTVRRMMGVPPGSFGGAFRSASSTLSLFILFLAACGVVWIVVKVGVMAVLAVAWLAIGGVIFHFRGRLDFGRVRAALRDPDSKGDVGEESDR